MHSTPLWLPENLQNFACHTGVFNGHAVRNLQPKCHERGTEPDGMPAPSEVNLLMVLTGQMAQQKVSIRDHSFLWQIFPNSTSQFAKLCGPPRQIFHIYM